MRAPLALVVVLLLVAGAVAHPGGAARGDRTAGTSAARAADPTWLGTTIAVQIRPSGDARWNVTFRFSLLTDNETVAFERFAEEFEAGEAGPDPEVYRQFVERASAATGRQMALRNVLRESRVGDGVGSVSLEFTWTSFARKDGERVVLGDVFRTGTGTWLPELEPGQTLVVHAPPNYAVESASTGHRNGTFRFEGPRSFEGGVVNATFVPQADLTPSPTPTTPSTTDSPLAVPPAGVGVAAAVAALLGAVVLLRGRRVRAPWGGGAAASGGGSEDGDAPAAVATEGNDGTAPSPDDPFADVDEELLSDEERVEVLLEANGGRMKQGDIVRETGWSNAKVSQLLSSMADEERLDKLRIGRENLITLPDEDVGHADDGD